MQLGVRSQWKCFCSVSDVDGRGLSREGGGDSRGVQLPRCVAMRLELRSVWGALPGAGLLKGEGESSLHTLVIEGFCFHAAPRALSSLAVSRLWGGVALLLHYVPISLDLQVQPEHEVRFEVNKKVTGSGTHLEPGSLSMNGQSFPANVRPPPTECRSLPDEWSTV